MPLHLLPLPGFNFKVGMHHFTPADPNKQPQQQKQKQQSLLPARPATAGNARGRTNSLANGQSPAGATAGTATVSSSAAGLLASPAGALASTVGAKSQLASPAVGVSPAGGHKGNLRR